MAPHTVPAQRLWLVERGGASLPGSISTFAGAVAILADPGVWVVQIRSSAPERASEVPLREGTVRFALQRDAVAFSTIDEAMAWAKVEKERLIARGWVEVDRDLGNRHGEMASSR